MPSIKSMIEWVGDIEIVGLVRAVIAVSLTGTMIYMVVTGKQVSDAVMTIYAMIAGYYFSESMSASRSSSQQSK